MQNSSRTEQVETSKMPNCTTKFIGAGNARRIMQTFSDTIVLENWLHDQRGIIKINGKIVCRIENVTLRKWDRLVKLIDQIAPVICWLTNRPHKKKDNHLATEAILFNE